MRKAFFEALTQLMLKDERITLVTGDLGFSIVEPIMAAMPKQYVNAGVAEQAMTGIAAGLALSGRVAFTYSICNFPTLRCLEQVRNDVCYHRADVKVVSVGGGLGYGQLGFTHHATEDLAILRALPNMTVIAPGDPVEAERAAWAAAETEGPFYLRIGRGGEPVVHPRDVAFRVGRAIPVRPGRDVMLLSTGNMLGVAVKVSDLLAAEGLQAGVLSVHTLKPLDEAAVLAAASRAPVLATLEEHSVLGGLGGAVAEVLLEAGLRQPPAFRRIGIRAAMPELVGDQDHLRRQLGLSPEGVVAQLRPLLEKALGHAPPGAPRTPPGGVA